MPILLKKEDMTKRGWQSLRPEDLSKSGMGAALDKWAPYSYQRGKHIYAQGIEKPAFDASLLVDKALKVAKAKADKIKDKTAKAKATEVVNAYSQWLVGWKADLAAGAAEHKAALEAARKKHQSEISKMKLSDVMKDAGWRKKFEEYCKRTHNMDNYLFMTVGLVPKQENFDRFIPQGAPLQVNVSSSLREAVEAAQRSGQLAGSDGKRAWMAVVKEVYRMVQEDTFRRFLIEEAAKV